jgi:hypothetical protein
MKKLFLVLFAALVLFPTTARPQFLHYFGVKAGFVSSSQNFEGFLIDDSEVDRTAGFSIAVFSDIPVAMGFSISPQIEYARRGWQIDVEKGTLENPDGNGEMTTFKYKLDYIIIPIMLKYSMDFSFGTAALQAGPRLDLPLEYNSEALDYIYKNFDDSFGISFGAAYAPKLALPVTPFIEIMYHMDITDAYESTRPDLYSINPIDMKIRNNAFNINLGVKF